MTPGDSEWNSRLEMFLNDPSDWQWWWLSFVDTDRSAPPEEQHPGGGGFLGVCIVPGPNMVAAASIAHILGCNPGGQVVGFPACPEGWQPKHQYVARLISGQQAHLLAEMDVEEYCNEVEN